MSDDPFNDISGIHEVRYWHYGGLMGGAAHSSIGAFGGMDYAAQQGTAMQQMQGATFMDYRIAAMMQQQNTPMMAQVQKKKVTMFGSMKKYFDDHRDLLMTLGVLIIVDQWVFDGAFKEKIKALIDRVVGHAENKVKQLEAKV